MSYDKPLPVADPVTQPFWDGLKVDELRIKRCSDCDKAVFYPRVLCPHCGSRQLAWTVCSGRGIVYAFTSTHRGTPAAFKSAAPYVVAMVELEEGARLMTNIIDVEPSPSAVKIGMSVEIVFDKITESVTLAKFRPR